VPRRFRLSATVGFGDDPENQAQMDVGIDFASGGHHMVCGTVSTGKSTFLQTAVFSLCSHYTPEQLNVYALDFS
jgi:S-DNA-T family DNA segregation ATPase FtsK/SpoIIIE